MQHDHDLKANNDIHEVLSFSQDRIKPVKLI